MQQRNLYFNKPVSNARAKLTVEDLLFDQQSEKYVAILSVKNNDENVIPTHVKTALVSVMSNKSYSVNIIFVASDNELKAERSNYDELVGIYSTEKIAKPCAHIKVCKVADFPTEIYDADEDRPLFQESLEGEFVFPKKYTRQPNSVIAKWMIGAGAFFAVGAAALISKAVDTLDKSKENKSKEVKM